MQERQDNQLQQELQELMQEKEDDSEEDTSDDLEVDAGILALHEENPDCIGWLTIDGTRIDYPVMYRPGDKNYYLHRDFNGEYSANGCFSPGSMLYSIGGAKSSSRLTAPSESVTSSFIIESGLPVYDKVILAFASGAPCCLSYTFMCIFPLSIISCGVSIV